jgi:hypothetical protein
MDSGDSDLCTAGSCEQGNVSLSYVKCGKFSVQPSGCWLCETASASSSWLDLFQIPFCIFECVFPEKEPG